MEEREAVEGRKLSVRVRDIVRRDGERSSHWTVFCPDKSRPMALSECLDCEKCTRVSLGGLRPFLICGPGAPAEAPTAEHPPVSAIMSPVALCVAPDVSTDALTGMMLERGLSGVPVVDPAGKPIGTISKTDLLRERWLQGETEESSRRLAEGRDGLPAGFHVERLARTTVAEVMTPAIITFHESTPVAQVAAVLAYEGLHRAPVVGTDGTVVGMLSALDILRWLAERNGFVVPAASPGARRATD